MQMWSQGFLHCSPNQEEQTQPSEELLRPHLGAGMDCEDTIPHPTGTLLPLSLKLKVSGGQQPVSAMLQLAEHQAGILSSWQNLLQPLGCSASPWMGLAGPWLQNLGFLQCFDTPPWDLGLLWERYKAYMLWWWRKHLLKEWLNWCQQFWLFQNIPKIQK